MKLRATGETRIKVMVLEKFTPVGWIALERHSQRTSNRSLSRRPAASIVADDLDPDEFVPTFKLRFQAVIG